jgi:hypothetical protein
MTTPALQENFQTLVDEHKKIKKTRATKNREMVRVPISVPPRMRRLMLSPIEGISLTALVLPSLFDVVLPFG